MYTVLIIVGGVNICYYCCNLQEILY